MIELKDAPALLFSASVELEKYIEDKNNELKAGITQQDLDEPDYHDYQTCHDLIELASKITEHNRG